MFAPFVFAGELVCQRDEAFIVYVEWGGAKLSEAQFGENRSEVHNILCRFDRGVGF